MPVGEPDDLDDFMIFPLTDIDGDSDNNNDKVIVTNGLAPQEQGRGLFEDAKKFVPAMSLRQRRSSRLGLHGGFIPLNLDVEMQTPQTGYQDLSSGIGSGIGSGYSGYSRPRLNWMRALRKIRSLKDPWKKFRIDDLPTETAIRHRYNALKTKWVKDEVQVKMEKEPFDHGAMRACYRLKKLSTFSRRKDWKHAMNYVAKNYMENVDRDVYLEDVQLQMDAKLWGEEYSRHNPPKKVDIFQMSVLEFKDRPGRPLFHLEHYIEGHYIKYNSNSGFVDESVRLTPQAFSHFTFERSGHQLIVVDIQGVGDLWTDPQVHTRDGKGYGDGNLGTKGMALFFHSHICNSICESLSLSKFDLSPTEITLHKSFLKNIAKNAMTVVRGNEEICVSPSPSDRIDLNAFLARNRTRTTSSASSISIISEESDSSRSVDEGISSWRTPDPEDVHMGSPGGSPEEPLGMSISPRKHARVRFLSESDDSTPGTLSEELVVGTPEFSNTEEERMRFQQANDLGARASCVAHEINLRKLHNVRRVGDSILGQIHHDMAKYHEIGRFATGDSGIDWEAAVFHEQQAAELGIKEAILTMANIYLGIQHDVLVNCHVEQTEENVNRGTEYMLMAAQAQDRSAMIYMAKAYETGVGLGTDRNRSYKFAAEWYETAIATDQDDQSGEYDATMDTPVYQLQAKLAELYLADDYNLEKDPSYAGELYTSAADGAMGAMKGRLANKYYALGEEAWALCEESEE